MSTGNRDRVVGDGVLSMTRGPNVWQQGGNQRRVELVSFGRTGRIQVDAVSFAANSATPAPVQSTPKPPLTASSSTGSKEPPRKARAVLARRIRPLRFLPPRFSHPRLKNRRVRVPATSTDQDFLAVPSDPYEYRPFLKTSGEADPAQWNRRRIDALLHTLDTVCIDLNEPSPSSAISRDLDNLASGKDLHRVWASFLNLTRIQGRHHVAREHFPATRVPSQLLSRLCQFITQSRPVTAFHFPALLTVMQLLWDKGTPPPRFWWNALIRFAAEGQRKGARNGTYKSLAVLTDYSMGLRPGSSLAGPKVSLHTILDPASPNKPNISTFNILINIAAESQDGRLLRDVLDLLKRSGLAPTRVTYLAQLKYYAEKRQIVCFREVVGKLGKAGMDLGVDGINACIWAYSLSNEHGVALDIYRVLRDNRTHGDNPKDIARLRKDLEARQRIRIPFDARPDKRTYVALIQTMAHSGKFSESISIFADFMECMPRGRVHASTAPAFRAIFCGFSKYGVGRLEELADLHNPDNKWNLPNLQKMYRLFLKLPPHVVPSRSTIYWIMVSFDKTSDHDVALLRERWSELEKRFAPESPWLFMQPRLQRIKAILFPSTDGPV